MKNKLAKLSENKWCLFLVCLFLGSYGVHRFLMKRWGSGILMLLLSLFGVSSIWAMIDLVRIALGKLDVKPQKENVTTCYATDGENVYKGVVS